MTAEPAMQWIHENPPHWDDDKATIVGGVPSGVFQVGPYGDGDLLAGEWWRVERDGAVVGYGWMDCTWGDAEILLAVAPDARGGGVGSFILDRLEREASTRGLNYLYNVVRETHPERDAVSRWLGARGFARSHDDESLRRAVRHGGG